MRARTLVPMLGFMAAGAAAAAMPQNGEPVPVNTKAAIHYFKNAATVAIDSVTTGYRPPNGRLLRDPKSTGGQIVRVSLTVTNTSETPFRVGYTAFRLKMSDGEKQMITSLINRGNNTDRLTTETLAPGASIAGALYYEVPASETLETLTLVYEGYEGSTKKDYAIALTPAPAAAAAPAPAAPAATDAPKPMSELSGDLASALAASLEGKWVLDEAKSKAAPDGNTAGVMKTLELTADGAFTALYGTKGTYTFDGQTLVVTYANSPGLQKKGAIEGAWLKFPAPAGLNRYCYMKRPD